MNTEYILVGRRVLDAVSQLGLVALAARQGDIGKEMHHFAGRGRRGAGGLRLMPPLGGWSDGRGGCVSVEPGSVGEGQRERVREGALAVRRQGLGRGRR